jgi:pimeloyl-ACP methyl ester carboxylesterase
MKYEPDQKYFFSDTEFLNYRIVGSGERTAVFLHGFGASTRTWDDIIPYLDRSNTRFILFDLIGAGFSSKAKHGDYTMRANAAAILSFLKESGVRDYVLAGHSFGGGVSLHIVLDTLADAQIRPSALMLLDAAAYDARLPFFVRLLKISLVSDFLLRLVPPDFQARFTLERLYLDKAKVTPEKVDRYAFFLAMKGYRQALAATARQISPEDWLNVGRYGEIAIPTLVLWGRQDPVLPIDHAMRLGREIPGARLGIIENCGHNVQEEQPGEVAGLINDFLASTAR